MIRHFLGASCVMVAITSALGCAVDIADDGGACAIFSATIESCQGETPEGFLAECEADPSSYLAHGRDELRRA